MARMDKSTIIFSGGYTVDVQGVASEVASRILELSEGDSYGYAGFSNATDGRDVYVFTGGVAGVLGHAS